MPSESYTKKFGESTPDNTSNSNDEPVEFTKNKRLIENKDGTHVGGGLNHQTKDPIDDVKLNKRGMSIYD